MKTIKGPGIFLAQFAGDTAPFNTLGGMADWAAGLGFTGIQIPTWDSRLFNLQLAGESQGYCDEILGIAANAGIAVTELSTHLQGQLVASHAAFDVLLEGFAPPELAGNVKACQAWAVQQLGWAAKGLSALGCLRLDAAPTDPELVQRLLRECVPDHEPAASLGRPIARLVRGGLFRPAEDVVSAQASSCRIANFVTYVSNAVNYWISGCEWQAFGAPAVSAGSGRMGR